MVFSVCMSCGHEKKAPYKKCPSCGFDPAKDEADMVKSVYLSLGRYDNEDEQERYCQELQCISAALARGEQISYEEEELKRLKAQKKEVESVKLWRVWLYVFWAFLPGIAFLGASLLLYYILKRLVFKGH